jgi:hypothetical protein
MLIPHYSRYEASEDGTIFSCKRSPRTICKVTQQREGPPLVQIQRDGKPGNAYVPVALLVASAFHGPQHDGMSVLHLDGDMTNSHKDNLTWIDPSNPKDWVDNTAAVHGFPGYFVTALGDVYTTRRGRVARKLSQFNTSGESELSVVMYDAAERECVVRVAYAVCTAFYGDANGTVGFRDGNRKNCTSDNVYWKDGTEDLGAVPPGARSIPGFPGYFIDEHATVYSTISRSSKGESVYRLTRSLDMADYWCVTLRRDGTQYRKRIHVLVAMAFHGVKENVALVARHLDDDRDNNHYSNIAWGTHEENMLDRDRNGTTARGPRLQVLTDEDVITIRRRCDDGEKPGRVGKDYRLRAEVIANIAARRTFTNVSERMT